MNLECRFEYERITVYVEMFSVSGVSSWTIHQSEHQPRGERNVGCAGRLFACFNLGRG